MRNRLTETEILEFLTAVAAGEITLDSGGIVPQHVNGDVRYTASNGWMLTVFNDCGTWDYLAALHKGGQSLLREDFYKH